MAIMINNSFDAISPMSMLKQNRLVSQRETQNVSTKVLNINDAINSVSAYSLEESLRIRTRTLNQVNKNIQDDTALLKTAQGSGNSIVDSIKEIQDLAIKATDETLTDNDRLVIQKDINRLVNQISSDAQITFNGKKLIDGSATTGNPETATVLSNDSLYRGTTANTALTALRNSSGINLGIEASDRITASYVKDGNIYTANFLAGNNRLEDVFKNLNATNGLTTTDNGMTAFTDAAFVGGGSGILKPPTIRPEPTAPTNPIAFKPVAPTLTKPVEVSMPVVPAEKIENLTAPPNIADYENVEDYNEAVATYDAIQAGTIKVLEKPTEPTDLTDPDYATNLDAYNKDLAAYNAAVAKYESQTAEERTAAIAAYSKYLTDKEAYDTEQENYAVALKEYNDYKKDYDENLLPAYQADMELYRAEYAQYQKDMADYRQMTAYAVQSDSDGVHVAATDSSGNAKSLANAALNNFRTTTFAADAQEDNSMFFQIGDTINQSINFGFNDMRAEAFGLKGANGNIISISTKADADAAVSTIANALSKATEQLTTMGSSEKKLGYIADSLSFEISNIEEPDSLVRNLSMAKTLTVYSANYFRNNTSQSIFAIANHR